MFAGESVEVMDYPSLAIFSSLVVTVFLLGFFTLRSAYKKVVVKLRLGIDFRSKFIDWCQSRFEDQEAYNWLMLHSTKMQIDMGVEGEYSSFRPPFENYIVHNYQIIMNMIPEIRKLYRMHDDILGRPSLTNINEYINKVDEALLRYIGTTKELEQKSESEKQNPMMWFRVGVERILSFPFAFLSYFGVLSSRSLNAIQANLIFKMFSAVATLVGLMAGLMSLILGWNQTLSVFGL